MQAESQPFCSALLPFLFGWEGFPTKIDYIKKKWYPYSNLSNLEDLGMASLRSLALACSLLLGCGAPILTLRSEEEFLSALEDDPWLLI